MWVSFGKIRIVGLKKNIINKRFLQNKSIDHWVRGRGGINMLEKKSRQFMRKMLKKKVSEIKYVSDNNLLYSNSLRYEPNPTYEYSEIRALGAAHAVL